LDTTNVNTAVTSAFAEELYRCGVRLAVISPGSRSTPLAVALHRQAGIADRVVLDERSAGFFALGAAQATGIPVVLVCTSGTAAANYHPAVAEADLSAVPLIVLTADRPPELRGIGAGQTIDQIKLYGSAVRWFSEVGVPSGDDDGLLHFRATACRAFALAAGDPRPGPVHLNMAFRDPLAPEPVRGAVTAVADLALHGRGEQPLTRVAPASLRPDVESLKDLARVSVGARRILVVAGRMAHVRAREGVTNFASHCGAPVLAEPTSQLRAGPHDRSCVIASYDQIASGKPHGLEPDLVIRIGEMPTSKALRTWLTAAKPRQIVIDPTFDWYEPTRTADVLIRAEADWVLETLAAGIAEGVGTEYLEAWVAAQEHAASELDSELRGAVTAGQVHRAIQDLSGDGNLVYTASSMAIRDQERYLTASDSDVLYLANRGANGIDGLIASGAGAATATGRPTTIITGDLGLQHDVGSLALVADSPSKLRVVAINDGGGRIFSKLPQRRLLGDDEFDHLMRTPGNLDIEGAARSFGCGYRKVEDLAQLAAAFGSDASVIEIPVQD
jgi:2-succinyl-5-enolpyruvyl-6-hydroxy-3-cyclohexene-1-carboxylate synthase